jgi:tetratricopeptide (TPR) repeat protein
VRLRQPTATEPKLASEKRCACNMQHLCRYPEAIDVCETVLNLNSIHYGAWSGMGLCYDHVQKREKAVECFERALEICPHMNQVRQRYESLKKPFESAGDGI